MDYYSVDPWDERRADLRDATNTAVVVNELRGLDNTVRVIGSAWGGKVKLRHDILHPRDLIPIFDPDEREREREGHGEWEEGRRRENDAEQERRKAREYAARWDRERREAKALLGLGEGIRPGAMEPVMVGG